MKTLRQVTIETLLSLKNIQMCEAKLESDGKLTHPSTWIEQINHDNYDQLSWFDNYEGDK